MSKPLKQLLLFVALVIFIQVISSPFQNLGDYIYLTIKDQLQPIGMEFNAKEANYSLPAKLIVPFSEVKWKDSYGKTNLVALQDLQVSLSIWELLKLKRSIEVFTNVYKGNAKIDLAQGLFGQDSLDLTADVKQISLTELPTDYRNKIQGMLSATFEARLPIIKGIIDLSGNSKISSSIKIRDGSYKGGDNLMGLMVLPLTSDIKLDLNISGGNSAYNLDNLSFSSSLGTVSGNAKIEIGSDPRFPKSLNLDLKIDLTEQGASFFSEYLKLSSKTLAQPGHRKWLLKVDKAQNELFPKIESKPI